MTEIKLLPGQRGGVAAAPSSKSHAHRLLICAALGSDRVRIDCGDISKDIAATVKCLEALCADISEENRGLLCVEPRRRYTADAKLLLCGESGSTLRFLIPVCGALGESVIFPMEGRLADRPLAPLDNLLRQQGMSIEKRGSSLYCSGKLRSGIFEIPGDISSQYISGLLFALPLLGGDSVIRITGKTESSAYIAMTESALRASGIDFEHIGNEYRIPGNQHYRLKGNCTAEGDYSNGAFFLCMGALSERGITVKNMPENTLQGDKAVIDILRRFGAELNICGSEITVKKGELRGCEIDASGIPDLIPVLSVIAAAAKGETRIINAARLRLKESDRLAATAALLKNLGGCVTELSDGLIINGGGNLKGGTADSCNDHRIAMSAAVAACICTEPVTVLNPECTSKSFPRFWENFEQLERFL
ncbi:MAG: 3-phosphoshikimate 1-carboxyvinyltransferase [Bacillota bacterium]|nr:3-phosphoshikimate 1-carboxyvinyltransferase [Bacillota bacterium]